MHDEARDACREVRYYKVGGVERTVPWITADRWRVADDGFDVSVDVSEVLDEYGPGIYTVTLWGERSGDDVIVSEYSIFHEIKPTGAYSSP